MVSSKDTKKQMQQPLKQIKNLFCSNASRVSILGLISEVQT